MTFNINCPPESSSSKPGDPLHNLSTQIQDLFGKLRIETKSAHTIRTVAGHEVTNEGTAFEVTSDKATMTTRVKVIEGVVSFGPTGGTKIRVRAGQTAEAKGPNAPVLVK